MSTVWARCLTIGLFVCSQLCFLASFFQMVSRPAIFKEFCKLFSSCSSFGKSINISSWCWLGRNLSHAYGMNPLWDPPNESRTVENERPLWLWNVTKFYFKMSWSTFRLSIKLIMWIIQFYALLIVFIDHIWMLW